MKAADLLERNPVVWEEATRHPFLEAVREGSFPAGAFEAWLAQDYLFVGDALVFQARLLARAPRPAQAVLAGGLVAIESELGWFEEQAERLGLALDTPRHPTTAAYRDLLAELEGEPYSAATTALWAIETAYLEAWRGATPGHSEYRQFVEHWTTPEFVDYVTSLEKAADGALRGSDKQEREAGRVSLSGGCPAGEGLLGDGLVEGSAMSLAKTLWEENVDLTWVALEHRFVRGLGDGDLPLGSFQEYVAQDAFFLEAFARAYALALAQSPDRQGLHDFVELLAGVLEELELHGKYAERWSVELADVVPGEATLAYTDFLLATAALRGVGETCAAMTPCMRLYAFLGQSLADEGVDENNAYAEWIETYSDPDFETLTSTLEDLLDRYAADTPAVRAAYRRAMSLELAFFEANADGHSG